MVGIFPGRHLWHHYQACILDRDYRHPCLAVSYIAQQLLLKLWLLLLLHNAPRNINFCPALAAWVAFLSYHILYERGSNETVASSPAEHSVKVGIQIVSADAARRVGPSPCHKATGGMEKKLARPPKAKRKKRHGSREVSLMSLEFRGRLKVMFVTPSTRSAEVL